MNAAILAVIREVDATTPTETTEEVNEKDSAPVPDEPARAAKRADHRDDLRKQMLAAGCHPDRVNELVAARMITAAHQRITPVWATVCALETIAFWGDRTDDEIEADMNKLRRRDGGLLGPEKLYERIIAESSSPAEAAARINGHFGRRMTSARIYATMAVNELRRRRAVRAGIDPTTVKYLRVTGLPEVNAGDVITVHAEPLDTRDVNTQLDAKIGEVNVADDVNEASPVGETSDVNEACREEADHG